MITLIDVTNVKTKLKNNNYNSLITILLYNKECHLMFCFLKLARAVVKFLEPGSKIAVVVIQFAFLLSCSHSQTVIRHVSSM